MSVDPERSIMRAVRQAIIRWHRSSGREYPWRATSNPFHILVAEVFLRRTTAAAVMRAYPDFLERFPDAHTLSEASISEIRKYVEALGLQAQRSKHLHELATKIVNDFDGVVPTNKESLLALPGIGRYLAAAIRNFAFGQPEHMVDGNIVHLINRLFGLQLSGAEDMQAWQFVRVLGGQQQDKQFYWGMIDLVALRCLRKNPRCTQCPVHRYCSFFKGRTRIDNSQ
ncbi:MAG: hypothetical protein ACFFEF_17715 [Candidatus Thorarchaeota archaeon]